MVRILVYSTNRCPRNGDLAFTDIVTEIRYVERKFWNKRDPLTRRGSDRYLSRISSRLRLFL